MPNKETLPLAIDTVLDAQESAYGTPPFFPIMQVHPWQPTLPTRSRRCSISKGL